MGAQAPLRLFAVTRHGPNPYSGLRAHPQHLSVEHHALSYWSDYAKIAEHAGLDGIWWHDHPVALTEGKPLADASYLIPALAAQTASIGFIVDQPTSWHQPYPIARKLSTLDNLTGGRFGFSVVTSPSDKADKAFGMTTLRSESQLSTRAEEFLSVLYKLFELSWQDDATVADKDRRIFNEPDRIHDIGHAGNYFSVPGVHLVDPTPQRTPLVAMSGSTGSIDTTLAGKHAELVLLRAGDRTQLKATVEAINAAARSFGRQGLPRIIFEVTPIGEQDDVAALARYNELVEINPPHLGRASSITDINERFWSGQSSVLVGNGVDLAGELQALAAETGIAGFGIKSLIEPENLADFAKHVLPHLERPKVPGQGTLRQRLGGSAYLPADHPVRFENRGTTTSVHSTPQRTQNHQ